MLVFGFTGVSMAVYTPLEKITTCEILPNGRYIVLALHNHPNLVTLKLHRAAAAGAGNNNDDAAEAEDCATGTMCYGQPENEGKVSQL